MKWGKIFKGNSENLKSSNLGSGSHLSGAVKYVGKDATVILDKNKKVLTTWANSEEGFRFPREPHEKLNGISEEGKVLLKTCLGKYRTDLLEKINLVETWELEDSVVNEMREAVGNELLNSGFEKNGETNKYGLMLEELIDTLSHYWKCQRNNLKKGN